MVTCDAPCPGPFSEWGVVCALGAGHPGDRCGAPIEGMGGWIDWQGDDPRSVRMDMAGVLTKE